MLQDSYSRSIRVGCITLARVVRRPPLAACLLFALIPTPSRACADNSPPSIGKPLPELSATDAKQKRHSISEFKGRPVVLFFFCGCEECHSCAQEWAQLQRSGALGGSPAKAGTARTPARSATTPMTIVVFQGAIDEADQFARETGLLPKQTLMLADQEAKTTLAYAALPCPKVFVADGKAVLRSSNVRATVGSADSPELRASDSALAALRAIYREAEPKSTKSARHAAK